MSSEDGSQHLTFTGGELFYGYPGTFGWPAYGIIPNESVALSSASSLATSVAGSVYTATIAVADPLWHTLGHETAAQMLADAQAAWGSSLTAADLAANGVWIATPTFALDILANGVVVGSATLSANTAASQPVNAGQWYDLTVTWTAPASGENITLQASASQFAEGAKSLGHTLQASEGPQPWTTTDASFDNARLTVTEPRWPFGCSQWSDGHRRLFEPNQPELDGQLG